MEVLVERGCGLDVHQANVVATLLIDAPGKKHHKEVRSFATDTGSLEDLREWLISRRCTHVAMESSGIYWVPVFEVLEGATEIIVANAHHIRRVPGRKTDVSDSEWIAVLLRHGLLSKSFVPPKDIRELRVLARFRRKIVEDRTTQRNRLLKVLETANVKLASVASDVFGVSGMAMLRALIDGTSSPEAMAQLAKRRLRAKIPQLERALVSRINDEHRLTLRMLLTMIEQIDEHLAQLDARIEEKVRPYHQQLELLDTIPGVDRQVAISILAELGPDMSVFETAGRCASWAGTCPGSHESAGKKAKGTRRKGNPHLMTMLVQAAHAASRVKRSYFKAKFYKLRARRGTKRAKVAIAHKILVAAFHILKNNMPFQDLGETYLDSLNPVMTTNHHVKRLNDLGWNVVLTPKAA